MEPFEPPLDPPLQYTKVLGNLSLYDRSYWHLSAPTTAGNVF